MTDGRSVTYNNNNNIMLRNIVCKTVKLSIFFPLKIKKNLFTPGRRNFR